MERAGFGRVGGCEKGYRWGMMRDCGGIAVAAEGGSMEVGETRGAEGVAEGEVFCAD